MSRDPLLLKTSISVGPGITDGGPLYVVKIQTDAFELNVWVAIDGVAKFDRVRAAPWMKGAVRIGRSAKSPAFWCVGDEDNQGLSILVGHDDQTWDIAVSLPLDTIDVIRREIAACPVPTPCRRID
jgi:hypothetical protein